jgi:hypothetical protein
MRPETNDAGAAAGGRRHDVAGLDSGRTSYLTADELRALGLDAAEPTWMAAAGSPKPTKRKAPKKKPGSPKPGSPKPGSPKPGSPKPKGSPKP